MLQTVFFNKDQGEQKKRLVLFHGFTQNSHCWGSLIEELATEFEVIGVDAPGHGGSTHDEVSCSEAGDLLVEAGGSGVYIGYSMGGRIALHAACSAQAAASMNALVLIGATAGIEECQAREHRRTEDEALAARIERIGVAGFIDEWLQKPMFQGLSEENRFRHERLKNRPEGLAASLRHRGTGAQQSLWTQLTDVSMPILLIVGKQDAKFLAEAKRLEHLLPNAVCRTVSDTGHAVHVEQPEVVAQHIADFVSAL